MNKDLKREIIFDNYQEPFHKGLIEDNSYIKVNTSSDSCIDNLDFMMKVEDNIIRDIRFDGEACAISTSAASILIRNLIGKSVNQAIEVLNNYKNMINKEIYDCDIIGELSIYEDISNQPNRIGCALLPSVAIDKLLGELNNEK